MSILYKISFGALLIALFIILSRFLSIPYLFGLPFVKISISSSVVAFASFYLGPVFGLIVGTFGDVIAAIAFPQGGEFNPLFTIASSLGGLMPYLIYKLINYLKVEKKFPFILGAILIVVPLTITLFLIFNNEIHSPTSSKIYILYPWIKITLGITIWILSIVFLALTMLLKKKFKSKKFNRAYNIYNLASSLFITTFLFKIPMSSLAFFIVFSIDYRIVFMARLITGFFSVFVDIVLCIIALDVALKFSIRGALIKDSYYQVEELTDGREPTKK